MLGSGRAWRAGCLLSAGLVLWIATAAWGEVRDPNGVAVIVGNRAYEREGLPEAAYAHRDEASFKRYVIDVLGYDPQNVIELTDARLADLVSAFGNERSHEGELWSYLDPAGDSDVAVYYSGHGVPGADGRGYLLPSDGDPDRAELTGYPLDLLFGNLAKLEEARTVVVYLDASFSGDSHAGMLVTGEPVSYAAAEMPAEPLAKVTVLTAASGTEVASWDEEARHGLFTNHLLDALYGGGDADSDGQVTVGEAHEYLSRHLTRAARRTYRRRQNPTLAGPSATVVAVAVAGAFPERPALDAAAAAGPAEPDASGDGKPDELTATQTIQYDKYVLGLEAAHEAEEHERVLEYAEKLRGFGDLAADVQYREGLAYAGLNWHEAAKEVLTGYVERTGRDGERYQEVLKLLLELERMIGEEAVVYAHARRHDTARAYRIFLEAYPQGRHAEEARRLQKTAAGWRFRDCEECPALVVVPAGSYLMGSSPSKQGRHESEGPQHRVTIAEAFAVGMYEVTRDGFGRFVDDTGWKTPNGCLTYEKEGTEWEWKEREGRNWRAPGFEQTDSEPVVCVNWNDARGHVDWLSSKTGQEYRLLSEAEWEYVARGGTETARYWGEDEAGQCRHANGADATAEFEGDLSWGIECNDGYYRTAPVGSFLPNAYGVYDVLGNVWEWTADCWNGSYEGAPVDGSVWEQGECGRRVVRGGSWLDVPRYLRSAFRFRSGTGLRYDYVGFRVARTLES